MNGELTWHPISYDSGPGTDLVAEISFTEIDAPDFPSPQNRSSRHGGPDSLLFANSVLEVLLQLGRSPGSVVWAANHFDDGRGPTHCFVFEQRQIYSIRILSDEYEAWLDLFDTETVERFSKSQHPVPEVWFMSAEIADRRVMTAGGFPFASARNGEFLDQYERAEQFNSDLHEWMRAASPAVWHGQDDRPKKDEILREAAQNAGSYVAIDQQKLEETFERLLIERDQMNHRPTTDADIAQFEQITGFEMPSELQAVLRIADGCYLSSGYCDFMSAAAITSAWARQNEAFDGSTLERLTRFNRNPDSRTLPIDISPKWIPITDHRSGAYVGIDLLPGPNGTPGQLVHYDLGESGAGAVVLVDNLLEFFEHELAGRIVNIGDPIPLIIDDVDEWENEEDDEEVEIVEESWISIKLHEQSRRAAEER